MIFGSTDSLESYCAHLLLSKDEVYFAVQETKGFHVIYRPRPTGQVHLIYFILILIKFLRTQCADNQMIWLIEE